MQNFLPENEEKSYKIRVKYSDKNKNGHKQQKQKEN